MSRTIETISERYPDYVRYFPKAVELLRNERERQISLWGDQDFIGATPNHILTVLSEEHGEIARAILEHDDENLVEEITQLGALCVKWLELLLKEQNETKKTKGIRCS